MGQIDTIAGVLSAQPQGDVGFVKVILRREAWAKSHRPIASLFRHDRTPVVGGGDLGVMLVEARPGTLRQVAAEIAKAETHTETRFNEQKQKDEPYPSARKSETGAIDRIELYGPSDRRSFHLVTMLLRKRAEITHPEPETAIKMAFLVLSASLGAMFVRHADRASLKAVAPTDEAMFPREMERVMLGYLCPGQRLNDLASKTTEG